MKHERKLTKLQQVLFKLKENYPFPGRIISNSNFKSISFKLGRRGEERGGEGRGGERRRGEERGGEERRGEGRRGEERGGEEKRGEERGGGQINLACTVVCDHTSRKMTHPQT